MHFLVLQWPICIRACDNRPNTTLLNALSETVRLETFLNRVLSPVQLWRHLLQAIHDSIRPTQDIESTESIGPNARGQLLCPRLIRRCLPLALLSLHGPGKLLVRLECSLLVLLP